MLTKSFPAACYNPHDHARAEHHEYADDEDDQREAFLNHREGTPLDSEDISRQHRERHESLEGWRAAALSRHQMSSFTGQPGIKGRHESIRMMLLCAIHFGITFTWYGFFSDVKMTMCHARRFPIGIHRLLFLRHGL